MDVALWVAQGLLALIMLMAGLPKINQPREKMLDRMAFVEDFTDGPIRTIGILEVLAAVGLILPGLTGIAPILVPLAAVGVALIQMGAIVVHVRRSESRPLVMNLVLVAIAIFIAWGRLGDYPL
jgi:uncharacterized membrane protein YphA (DoxX/SURF4 family)